MKFTYLGHVYNVHKLKQNTLAVLVFRILVPHIYSILVVIQLRKATNCTYVQCVIKVPT